jgi:nitroreductase
MRYVPVEHALAEIPGSNASATALREASHQLVDVGRAALVGLVAEPGKTAAKYEHHETLVWRDAGVVLGYMSLVAEALGLSFCPLGLTGRPQLTEFLPESQAMHGVGLSVLGRD